MIKKTLTKKDIIEKIHQKLGYSKEEAKGFIEAFFDTISEKVSKNEEVKIPKLGNFIVRKKAQRIGRNPKTGKEAIISKRKIVSFKASKQLKIKINEK
ncbi:MAG: integration host factor subunit alpha [Rickettsiales bacterium]|nr:integration host factor subunit alpha [Rickettsiales bacterium]|tara:strand:- start:92 stop:385 length:294 start_codon:yes stop_codon:yes gene_type:complete